jgi:N utilization substance protein B
MKKMKIIPRQVARFAAIQAIFQCSFYSDFDDIQDFLQQFIKDRFIGGTYALFDQQDPHAVDIPFFEALVLGTLRNWDHLEHTIQRALSPGRTPDRLDIMTLSLLRCGVFELESLLDVPPQVILNEYVTIAHFFLSPKGPGFVNGVLATLADILRQSSETDTEPEMETEMEMETAPYIDTNTEIEIGIDTETELYIHTDTELEKEPETHMEMGIDTKPDPEPRWRG